MAKKSNKKPGVITTSKKDSALVMKRKDTNILHKRFTKVILLLMALSFVGIPVYQLVQYIYTFFFKK